MPVPGAAASPPMTTALPDTAGAKAPAQVLGPALPAPASSADLALLAAQLQTLAEEMGRLRLGLDHLVAMTNVNHRPEPNSVGLSPLNSTRELEPLQVLVSTTGISYASAACGAEEARGRALWVQERLLEAQALLGHMMAGSQPPVAEGVFTDERLRRGPVHGKQSRDPAVAAAAATAAATATGGHGDAMELAGRHHYEKNRAQEEDQVQHVESASHSYAPAVGQLPVVGSDRLYYSRAGSGRDTGTPAQVVDGDKMAEAAAWDSGASHLGSETNHSDQSREGGGVETGASEGEDRLSRSRFGNLSVGSIPSVCGSCPASVAPQQHDVSFPPASAPSWLVIGTAQLPADPLVSPTQISPLQAENSVPVPTPAGSLSSVDFSRPGANRGFDTPGGLGSVRGGHGGDGCEGLNPATLLSRLSASQRAASGQQQRLWPGAPGGLSAIIISASQAGQAGQGPPSAQRWPDAAFGPFVQTHWQLGSGGAAAAATAPLQDLLPSLSSTGSAAAGGAAFGVGTSHDATRYCI
jgi:hypothetical protein